MARNKITINRAAVLTLWAAIVAERLGHSQQEALTLGRAVAGLNAQSKGRRLGIYEEKKEEAKEKETKEEKAARLHTVTVLGRAVPVVKTPHGLRAAVQGQAIDPESVQTYLEQKFGDDLDASRLALEYLAKAYTPRELDTRAYALYEKFRPEIPEGKKGWGAKGDLDLDYVRSLAK
jgi:hypothetical protein